MGGIGEVRPRRFKKEGKRRQKGKRLIVTKKRVESTVKAEAVSKRKVKVRKIHSQKRKVKVRKIHSHDSRT